MPATSTSARDRERIFINTLLPDGPSLERTTSL
jgi:hypothetical protein